MRCPKCKTELVNGESQQYETLLEHVSDPNLEDYPFRPTFICPNKCFNGFYDEWGDYYGRDMATEERYWYALDSESRKSEIKIRTIYAWGGTKYKNYTRRINNLKIDGETDVPTYLIRYFLKVKLNYIILLIRRSFYGKRKIFS